MDIVGRLPTEVGRFIFAYLSVVDLGRCLGVSKRWRNIANDNALWKKHCIAYEVPDSTDNFQVSDTQSLCHWALEWRRFGISAYKWHSDKYKEFEIFRSDYTSFALFDTFIVAYSEKYNNIDVYSITARNRVRLLTSIAVCLPKDSNKVTRLTMNCDYIVILKYNIILVFKKNDSDYELFKAFAALLNTIVHADRNISSFINSNLNEDAALDLFGVVDDLLWLSVDFEGSFVINIFTNEVVNVFTFDSGELQGNLFTTWSDNEIRIYDRAGSLLASIDVIWELDEVITNETLVAILRGTPDGDSVVDIWELQSAFHIFSEALEFFSFLKLHPKEETLYTLQTSVRPLVYRVTSWDVRSRCKQWALDRTCDTLVTSWHMHFVCNRYLVVWSCPPDQNKFFLLNYKTGKMIYEKPGPVFEQNCITDKVWISLSRSKKVFIRSYL